MDVPKPKPEAATVERVTEAYQRLREAVWKGFTGHGGQPPIPVKDSEGFKITIRTPKQNEAETIGSLRLLTLGDALDEGGFLQKRERPMGSQNTRLREVPPKEYYIPYTDASAEELDAARERLTERLARQIGSFEKPQVFER